MKKKQISALVLAAILASSMLFACASTSTAAEPAITREQMNTIDPPKDGWTEEQLNQVMYLNGKQIKLPCPLADLGEDYSISDEHSEELPNDCVAVDLLYKGKQASRVEIKNYNTEDAVITKFGFWTDAFKGLDYETSAVNGIFLGSSYDDVIKHFNDDTPQNTNIRNFYLDSEELAVVIIFRDDTRKVDMIFLMSKPEEE